MDETKLEEIEKKPKKVKKKKTREITVKANKKGRHIMPLLNFLRVTFLPFYWLVKPFRMYGHTKVQDGACIYVGNHLTMLDPVYPAVTTGEGIHYVAKRELFEQKFMGGLLHGLKGICANRDGNDVRAVLDCYKCLKNGEKVCIYPEGTRNKTGEILAPFERGAAALAIKAKVPVVPIMLYTKPRYFRKTHVLVGEPFEFTEYYGKKLTEADYEEADNRIRDTLLALHAGHTEFLANKKKKKKEKKA